MRKIGVVIKRGKLSMTCITFPFLFMFTFPFIMTTYFSYLGDYQTLFDFGHVGLHINFVAVSHLFTDMIILVIGDPVIA